MAIASFVIGLVILIGGLVERVGLPMGLLRLIGVGTIYSFPIAVVGLVFGILGVRKKPNRGLAIAGIVMNSLFVIFPIVVIIVWGIQGD